MLSLCRILSRRILSCNILSWSCLFWSSLNQICRNYHLFIMFYMLYLISLSIFLFKLLFLYKCSFFYLLLRLFSDLFFLLFLLNILLLLLLLLIYFTIFSCKSLITLSRVSPSKLLLIFLCLIWIFVEFFHCIRLDWALSRFLLPFFNFRKGSWLNFTWLNRISWSDGVSLIKTLPFLNLFFLDLNFLNLILRLALNPWIFISFQRTCNRLISPANNILIHWQILIIFSNIFLLFLSLIQGILILLILPLS